MRLLALPTLLSLLLGGCLLESPHYEGTEFSCAEPEATCPADYVCVEQVCRPEGYTSDPAEPDAGVPEQPATPDARPAAPDADVPPPDADVNPLETAILTGDAIDDTRLDSVNTTRNYGEREQLRADASPARVALLRFDVSSIPPNAIVESAQLILHVAEELESGELIGQRLLEEWFALEATWNIRKLGVPWTTAGAGTGSYAPAVLFSFAAPSTGPYTVPLSLSVVQGWVARSIPNYGMRLSSTSPDGHGGDIYSKNYAAPSGRPLLRIQYRTPLAP